MTAKRRIAVVVGLALFAGSIALVFDLAGGGGVRALTFVIAATTVAYAGFTYLLVASADADRTMRIDADRELRRQTLRSLGVELDQNLRRKGQTDVYEGMVFIPYEVSSLLAARWLLHEMSAELQTDLTEVTLRVSRYNTFAEWVIARVADVSDGRVTDDLVRLAGEVHDSLESAAWRFDREVRPTLPASSSRPESWV